MATDSPSHGGRRHFHRGRRGDRRGGERRTPSQPQPQRQAGEQPAKGDVDVEQIMRDIRANIAQRHGIELTDQQVQELAARRLESILDPRTIKPSLLDQLRRAAGARPEPAAASAPPPYTFEDTTLFESPNGFVRFMRKLLAPVLKLFFNPNPLIRALNIQARVNAESAKREAERDQRQAEWNALHYELLQRVVSETAKVSLEVQSLALRVESLAAKVDFNERRVRGIEGTVHQARPAGQRERDRDRDRDRDKDRDREREMPAQPEPARTPQPSTIQATPEPVVPQAEPGTAETPQGEAPRRRRRRRRGRRGGGGEAAAQPTAGSAAAAGAADAEEGDEDEVEATDGESTVTEAAHPTEYAGPNEDVRREGVGRTDDVGRSSSSDLPEGLGGTDNGANFSSGRTEDVGLNVGSRESEPVTTEREPAVEPGAAPATGMTASLPAPDHELPAGPAQERGPDHLLEPATRPEDPTPDRGER